MNLFMQALLTSIVTWIGFLDKAFLHTFLYRPIVIGPLVGLVFGDLSMGLQVGVSVELMFLAVIFVGTAIPPDETISAALATALRRQIHARSCCGPPLFLLFLNICFSVFRHLSACITEPVMCRHSSTLFRIG